MGVKERREREKQARREQILKTARELLHEKGINGASMNQIAKRAELGVATLYSYFESKEHLFLTIQQEGLELLRELTMKAVRKEVDPAEKLKKIAMAYLEFSQKRKDYYYIINYFVSTPEILFKPTEKGKIDEHAGKSMQYVETTIQEGIDAGVFQKTNVRRCTIMFWGMINGLTQYRKFETTLFRDDDHLSIYIYAVEKFVDSLR